MAPSPQTACRKTSLKKRLLTREERGAGDIRQGSGTGTALYDGVWRGGRRGQKEADVQGQASDKGPFQKVESGVAEGT